MTALHAWRHPKAAGAEGRCIGARTDLAVDPRKARRLAHRIRRHVRAEGLPRVVATSPLRRCRDVARWLRRFGFAVCIDARLVELDFGRWDSQRWGDIPRAAIDAWAADLDTHRPGGDGECVRELRARVAEVMRAPPAAVLVTHGGWISAAMWQRNWGDAPAASATWPPPCATGERVSFP